MLIDGDKYRFHTIGKIHEGITLKPFNLDGNIDTIKNTMEIKFNADKLDVPAWANYIIPIAGIQFLKGQTDVALELKNRTKTAKQNELPFDLNVVLSAAAVAMKVPWIKPEIQDINGRIVVNNEKISFYNLQGTAAKTLFVMNGSLSDFANFQSDLRISAKKFDASNARDFYPFLSKWQLKGNAVMELSVKSAGGQMPVITGHVEIPTGSVYNYPFTQGRGTFVYKDMNLSYSIDRGYLYDGQVFLTGNVNLITNTPLITAHGEIKGLTLSQMFPGATLIKGRIDADFLISGIPAKIDIKTEVLPKSVYIIGQPVKTATILLTYQNDIMDFTDVKVWTAAGDLVQVRGKLFADKSFVSSLNLSDVYFSNVNMLSDKIGLIEGRLNGNANTTGRWTNGFTSNPLHFVKVEGRFLISDLAMARQKFDYLKGQLKITDDKLFFSGIDIFGSDGHVISDLVIDSEGLNLVKIKANNFNIAKYPEIISKLPEQARNISGIAAFSVNMNRNNAYMKSKTASAFFSGFNINGEVSVLTANYNYQPIKQMSMNYFWNGDILQLTDIRLSQGFTHIEGSGFFDKNKKFSLKFNSNYFVIDDFNSLTKKVGKIGGRGRAEGEVFGTLPSWNVTSTFDVKPFRYNSIIFDRIRGQVQKRGNNLRLYPVAVEYKTSTYNIDGSLVLTSPLRYDIAFNVNKGEIRDILKLAGIIKNEYQHRGLSEVYLLVPPTNKTVPQLLKIGSRFDPDKSIELYNNVPGSRNIISEYNRNNELASNTRSDDLGLEELAGGKISGQLALSNRTGSMQINSNLSVTQGHIGAITFESMKSVIFSGSNQTDVKLTLNTGQIGEGSFDEISMAMLIDDKSLLHINQMTLSVEGRPPEQIISGTISLAKFLGKNDNNEIDLQINLKKNNLTFLSLFTKNILWMKNEGNVAIHIGGFLDKPILTASEISLTNAQFKLADDLFIKSPLKIDRGSVLLQDNIFFLNDIGILWEGKDTLKKKNQFVVSGKIELQNLTFLNPDRILTNFDLKIKKTSIKVNLPELYIGEMLLSDTDFHGLLTIPLSKLAKSDFDYRIAQENESGPLLLTEITLLNGEIPIPDSTQPKPKPSILLSIKVNIAKNVLVSGGNFSKGSVTSLINNLAITIAENKVPLIIRGSLNTIIIDGGINFESGEVGLMNKDFKLMTEDSQSQFFDSNMIKPNSISFVMVFDEQLKRRRIKPMFHLVAYDEIAQVVSSEQISSVNVQQPITQINRSMLIFLLDGSVLDPMAMSVYLYRMNTGGAQLEPGYPYVFGKLTYSQLQDLSRYLFPELLNPQFYGEILGSGLSGQQTKQVFRNISEKQINSLLAKQLRPLERQIADKIGLYDLRFDYDLGKTLSNAVVGQDDTATDTTKIFGVDLAFKLFLDKLFVRINTQVDQAKFGNNYSLSISEYTLTYAILQWLSLNYKNRILNNDITYKGGVSLEAQYDF